MKKIILFSILVSALLFSGATVFAYQNPTVSAGPDLYLTSGQTTTLQGTAYDPNGFSLSYHWSCTGGSLSSYNVAQPVYTAPYAVNNNNQTSYICTLTATNIFGLSASDNMTVFINYNNIGTLTVTKKVINLTAGNLNWQSSVAANPGDVLAFAIILQAGNQDIHNVIVRDTFPAYLSYADNMTVNANLNYGGTPMSGINIGTISANGIQIISYQAKVASSATLPYGISTLSNNATITSTEAGTQTAVATVLASNTYVAGANYNPTSLPTGLTNDPVKDSFFLPLFLIILGMWFYFSGKIYIFADWVKSNLDLKK
jgi:hypothetical protein